MTDDPAWDGESRRIDGEFLRDQLDGELPRTRTWSPARPTWWRGRRDAAGRRGRRGTGAAGALQRLLRRRERPAGPASPLALYLPTSECAAAC